MGRSARRKRERRERGEKRNREKEKAVVEGFNKAGVLQRKLRDARARWSGAMEQLEG